MHINHLDLQVRDVQATRAFFEENFGLTLQSNPNSHALVIMTDASGFVLVLQKAASDTERYPDGFHLGFLMEDVESVHAAHARALANRTPVSDVIVNGRGTMIYLTAPEGYAVEVACHKRTYPPSLA
jgi:catechol 2,3-dioxygenase-like lactoylglutathione lyase family enzyme